MRLLETLRTSMSALTAERLRLDLIAGNLANLNTTRTPAGEPYRRLVPVFSPRPTGGVEVTRIVADPAEFPVRHDPGHPDADADGLVRMPNVDLVSEMVDLMAATRAYEANAAVAQATRNLAQRTLEIGRS